MPGSQSGATHSGDGGRADGLRLDGLHGVRAGRLLFAGLDVHVARGQLLRVQGANGAGKTSLLRMICGLLPPLRGQVLWQEQRVSHMREEFGRQVIFLGHAAALKDELSALENLMMAVTLGGLKPDRQAALGALHAAGLEGRVHAPAGRLSQGQRRRSALARLMLTGHAAPLWILDEPFNALDAAATSWLIDLITAHLSQAGVVVLTSHQSVALPGTVSQVVVSL